MSNVYSYQITLRQFGFAGASILVFFTVCLFYLLTWHRAQAFEAATTVLFWQNIMALALLLAMIYGPLHQWLAGDPVRRNRLRAYVALIVAILLLPPILLDNWTPTILVFLIGFQCFLMTAAGTILSETKFRKGLYYLFGSVLAIFIVFQYSAQVRLLKQFDWASASPKKILTVLVGTSLDAADSMRSSILMVFDKSSLSTKSKIAEVRLRIEPDSIETMAKNLPASAKEKYYDGQMLYPDGSWKRIKYRMRGQSFWHWMPEKPSLRVRLRKGDPLNLQRHINFVNPEDRAMVSNILGDEIARNMGVLTHKNQFVRLYINNKFFGVYHQTTREDEEMLRLNRRIPGPIVVGDSLSIPWKAGDFEYAEPAQVQKNDTPLEQMVSAINSPLSVRRYEKLWDAMSFEQLARWDAALKIVGGIHTDVSHNHTYYFDPRLGKLEPILTDVNGHGLMTHPRWLDRHLMPYEGDIRIPLNERLQPLLDAALRDPRFAHRRNEIAFEALTGAGSVVSQFKILDRYFSSIDQDVFADRQKAALEGVGIGVARQPFSNMQYRASKDSLRRWIKDRNTFLKEELLNTNVTITLAPNQFGGTLFIVSVFGNSAVDFEPSEAIHNLSADRDRVGTFKRVKREKIRLYPGLKKDFDYKYSYIGSAEGRYYLMAGKQSYLFQIDNLNPSQAANIVKAAFKSSLSGEPIPVRTETTETINPVSISYNANTVHPWAFAPINSNDILIGPGVHEVTTDIIIGTSQRLRVSAGAHLKLAPEVSIISRGQVLIEGTKENPVSITRLKRKAAWGGLLIIGKASSESKISFTNISGGSLAKNGNLISSGMVSIYDSDNTLIADSSISNNILSDDTLHVVYGNVRLLRNHFADCFGDCIDFDYTSGEVKKLTIDRSGNDGFDFMSSKVNLTDIKINITGDKGLSIGELSDVDATNVVITQAVIAIAVKDSSKLRLSASMLSENEIGVDLYRKNWRYGGPGNAILATTVFSNNQVDARSETESELTLDKASNPITFAGDGKVNRIQ